MSDDGKKSNLPDLKEVLEKGRLALYQDLVAKIEAGTASHQEKSLFYKMLSDAGLNWVPDDSEKQQKVVDEAAAGMPEFDEGDSDGEG